MAQHSRAAPLTVSGHKYSRDGGARAWLWPVSGGPCATPWERSEHSRRALVEGTQANESPACKLKLRRTRTKGAKSYEIDGGCTLC